MFFAPTIAAKDFLMLSVVCAGVFIVFSDFRLC